MFIIHDPDGTPAVTCRNADELFGIVQAMGFKNFRFEQESGETVRYVILKDGTRLKVSGGDDL